jgi:hypothetical protein
MPTFRLGHCSIELRFDPLASSSVPAALTAADRQLAWRLYLALQLRPELHGHECPAPALRELLASLEQWLGDWPAAQIDEPNARQLGHALTAVAEFVLRPCLQAPQQPSARPAEPGDAAWPAVRAFLQDLARELARAYRFPDAGLKVPEDLLAAWRDAGTAGAAR